MSAIIDSNRRAGNARGARWRSQAWTVGGSAGKAVASTSAFCGFVLPAILGALFLCHDFAGPAPAFGAGFEVTPIAELTINSDGEHLRFPTYLFYDRSFDETYVVDGAKAWVVVYAGDFFPLASFASGRGIYRPQGGFVDPNGLIYICQQVGNDKPARITVFNGAFIPVREFFLDNIPKVADFYPTQVVVSRDGLMYVAGQNLRGVVVLDNDGTFLRWLRPLDETFLSLGQIAALEGQAANGDGTPENGDLSEPSAEQPAKEDSTFDIPEQFRPKTKEEKEAESGPHIGPVRIRSVSIDSAGRLYLLSDETSKTYVYNAEETFLFSFGTKGGTPRTLSNPRGVAIDEDRHIIYVVDYMRHAILTYDQEDGKFLFEFGGKGKGPGWFNFPDDIAVNQRGQVIVADLFNHRVQVLEVKYQRDFSLSQQPPKAVAPAAAVEGAEQARPDTESTASPAGEIRKESLPDAEHPVASDAAGDLENAGEAPIIETHGVIEEEAIQDGEPTEAPAADAASHQEGPDEEKDPEGK